MMNSEGLNNAYNKLDLYSNEEILQYIAKRNKGGKKSDKMVLLDLGFGSHSAG